MDERIIKRAIQGASQVMRCGHTLFILLALFCVEAFAQSAGLPAVTVETGANGQQQYHVSFQILLTMAMIAIVPALLMSITAFTRIYIVLAILRQAIGMGATPTNQILIGIAFFMTLFVMQPTLIQIHHKAISPYLSESLTFEEAIDEAKGPLKQFMYGQTRAKDLDFFTEMNASDSDINSASEGVTGAAHIPFTVLMPAFLTSELKTAFQIGFLLFLPFLVIDLVVASVLMAMGMMMLSPMVISLPFKLMLFVLIDGWMLVLGSLSSSF